MGITCMDAVDSSISHLDTDKPFLMAVEDVFSVPGRATVATGTIERGIIKVQEEVELIGLTEEKRKVVISDIEMLGKLVDQGRAGDNVMLFIRGIQREEIEIGQVLAKLGSIAAFTRFTAQIHLLSKEEGGRSRPIFNNHVSQYYFRNMYTTGTITLPEGTEMCVQGDTMEMTIDLETPVAMEPELHFIIREGERTIGSGKVNYIIS